MKTKIRKIFYVSLSFGFCIWILLVFFYKINKQLSHFDSFQSPKCPNSLKAHRFNHLLKVQKDEESLFKTTTTNPPTILETIELRVKKVEEFCEVRNNQGCQVNNILVLKEKNLVWCPVYKSGTSAWMT